MESPRYGETCTSCGGNDLFARGCLEDCKFTALDNGPQASSTRFSRKVQKRNVSGQQRDPRQSSQQRDHSRDLHYTDMYIAEEQHYDTSLDQKYAYTYSLEAQVHSITASKQVRCYFTSLSLSAAGSKFR